MLLKSIKDNYANTILTNILISTFASAMILCLLIFFITKFYIKNSLNVSFKKNNITIAENLCNYLNNDLSLFADEKKTDLDKYLIYNSDVIYLIVYNAQGNIIYKKTKKPLPNNFDYTTHSNQLIYEDKELNSLGNFINISSPINSASNISLGTLQIGISSKNSINFQKNLNKGIFLISLLIFFGMSVLVSIQGRYVVNSLKATNNSIIKIMKEFSSGIIDLTERLPNSGNMTKWFNIFLDTVQKIIGQTKNLGSTLQINAEQLSSLTQEINAATEEITATVSNVATNADKQKNRTISAGQTIQEQGASLRKFISALDESTEVARFTHDTAYSSGQTIKSAIDKMNLVFNIFEKNTQQVRALSETTQEIDQVLEVITQIANQTNLLSLNAAIEAARAGESGKGFAVVADEISKLAEESSESVKKIAALIQRIQKDNHAAVDVMSEGSKEVTSGREIMTEADNSLDLIVNSVSNLEEKVSSISKQSQEQLDRIDPFQKSIQEIIMFAEENSSSLEGIAASMEELASSMSAIMSSVEDITTASSSLDDSIKNMKT